MMELKPQRPNDDNPPAMLTYYLRTIEWFWNEFLAGTPDSAEGGWQRVLAFVENPLFLLAVSIVGGLVGAAVFLPVMAVIVVCILLALRRSGAIADRPPLFQIACYVVVFAVSLGILLWVGRVSRDNTRQFIALIVQGVSLRTAQERNAGTKV